MSIIEIIPKRTEIGKSLELAAQYNAAFEYNDFFVPDILSSPAQTDALVNFYLKQPRDRSKDTLHGAFLDLVIHSSDPLMREFTDRRMRQSMDIAKILGVRGVVFHTNLIANFYDKIYRQNWLKRNVDYFLALTADYPDIDIYMENMFDLEPDMFAAFGEATRDCPTLHLCLDAAHAHLSNVPLAKWLERSLPYIRHIHLNDNNGISDLHLPIGQGNIDWQDFDQMMRLYRPQASILIENSSVDSQRQSLEFLEQHHIYPFSGA